MRVRGRRESSFGRNAVGTIFSGVGLISGIDIQSLVSQLMAIEARPRDNLLARISNINAQRTAYLELSARISAMLSRATTLSNRSFFRSSSVTSSNPDVLSVIAGDGAVPGSYNFIVRALATSHQVVSGGFAARDAALSSGTLMIESARGRVNTQTRLEELNGYAGVRRGSFRITDGDGNHADINISDALTLDDVIERINEADTNIEAGLRDDAIVLTETTGGDKTIRVEELDGGHAAEDLGFGPGHSYGTGELAGSELVYLADTTLLSALNDGNGLRRAAAGGDFTISEAGNPDGFSFTVDLSDIITHDTRLERLNHGSGVELGRIRITTPDNASFEIDLSAAQTIGDIKNTIEAVAEGVTVTLTSSRLIVSTEIEGEAELEIEDISGSAARDLGIAGSSTAGKIDGHDILHADTLADVISAINYASGNDGQVSATINGTRLVLNGTADFDLTVANGSKALFDLGFEEGSYAAAQPAAGRRIIGGLNTVLLHTLNGGRGFEPGAILIEAGNDSVTIDLTQAETLHEVVNAINAVAADLGVEAGYDATGTRLLISSTDGATEVTISDVGDGSFAASIGIAQTGTRIRSDNLQRQYISETTRLEDLNAGAGVSLGKMKITDSSGLFAFVDLNIGTVETLQDVIDAINAAGIGVEAAVNETGDGLLITDTAGGELALKIEDDSGTAARDLNILGESDEGRIDGSYELNLDVSGSNTLEDLVSMINEQSPLATASIMNDGTGVNPYRLTVTANAMGLAGELIVDGSDLGIDFSTLTRAQDAAVTIGNDPESGLLVTSSSNTLANLLPGLTINLTGVSDQPVTVTVSRDTESIVATLEGLVSDFNDAIGRLDELGGYDPETEKRGLLQGEGALLMIESRLFRLVTGTVPGATGAIQRLSQIGIKLSEGKLTFDEEKFREKVEADPEAVTQFFTETVSGVANYMKEQLEAITGTDGLIERREGALENQTELLSDRVDQLNDLLARKQQRLLRQFQAMEEALAALQSQQASLASLFALTEQ